MSHKAPVVSPLSKFMDCEQEQIQHLGHIQSFGALIEVSADWMAVRCSENFFSFLQIDPRDLIGYDVHKVLPPKVVHDIKGSLHLLHRGIQRAATVYGARITPEGPSFDISIHKAGESAILEFERSVAEDEHVLTEVQPLLDILQQAGNVDGITQAIVRHVRALTAFDRVMVYRFLRDHSGEVIAESRSAQLQAFLGLRYPASDIPPQARALYLRNTTRLISNVQDSGVRVMPVLDTFGQPLDLSGSTLRSVSPVHIEYLSNMGVSASFSISLIVDGKLWGLIACHAHQPRQLSLRRRAALEFYGRIASTLLESALRNDEVRIHREARAFHVEMMSRHSGFSGSPEALVDLIEDSSIDFRCDGCVAVVDGVMAASGTVPALEDIEPLISFLNRGAAGRVYSTHELSAVFPAAASYQDKASGILAIPVSRQPRDYLIFFRKELVQEVVWGGEPTKTIKQDVDGFRYGPRESFEAWRQTVRAQSEWWTETDLAIAEALRVTMVELLLRTTDEAEKFRRDAQDKQDTLIAELNHRVRNILTLIVGVVRQSRDGATSLEQFSKEVHDRVFALARAHDQITKKGWGAQSISEMIKTEASAYLGEKAERIYIHGKDAALEAPAFSTVALVVHELVTNSAKYGAFKDSRGSISIELERENAGPLKLTWRETASSVITPPTRRGFGSTLIERAIPHELGGTVDLNFRPEGLEATLLIPADHVGQEIPVTEAPVSTGLVEAVADQRIEGNVLLLEDNLLIALETEGMLLSLGADDVMVTSTTSAALTVIKQRRPDFALLDVNLGRETSLVVAQRLMELGVPFAFASGYGESGVDLRQFPNVQVLTKPYGAQGVMQAYSTVMRGAQHNVSQEIRERPDNLQA